MCLVGLEVLLAQLGPSVAGNPVIKKRKGTPRVQNETPVWHKGV